MGKRIYSSNPSAAISSLAPSGAYFVSTGLTSMIGSPTTIGTTIANTVVAIPFYLPFAISLTKVAVGIAVASAGATINIGLYNFSGAKLIDSGGLSTAVGSGTVVSAAISITLQPGWYYFVWAFSSITPTVAAFTSANSASSAEPLISARFFTSPNPLSGGALPATLGTLVPVQGVNIPMALFTP